MKNLILFILFAAAMIKLSYAQKYYTKNGHISFFSKAPLENIKADNNQVVCVLNTQNGQLQLSLLIKNFHFSKALMEQHFNETYLESSQYPKATFSGYILDIAKISFTGNNEYKVTVSGDLTIHGVTNKITTTGTIMVQAGKVLVNSTFNVRLSDYNITIPKIVKNNISETQQITVTCTLDNKI